MAGPMIVALQGNEGMAASLAGSLGGEVGEVVEHQFPDGEHLVRLVTPPGDRDVIVVETLDRPDQKVLPLVFLADVARELGATRVGLIAPYLGYMRQDARFREGEAVSSRSFARILSAAFDWMVTVDPHLHRYRSLGEIYACAPTAIHVAPELGAWIARNVARPLIVGPDAESVQWAREVGAAASAPVIVAEKTRRGDDSVSVVVPGADQYLGHIPVLVDDIISTGKTMIEAVRHLGEVGLPAPICLAVHAVFAAGAYENLAAARVSMIVTTNTIPHRSNLIDISHAIAQAIEAEALNAGRARVLAGRA